MWAKANPHLAAMWANLDPVTKAFTCDYAREQKAMKAGPSKAKLMMRLVSDSTIWDQLTNFSSNANSLQAEIEAIKLVGIAKSLGLVTVHASHDIDNDLPRKRKTL